MGQRTLQKVINTSRTIKKSLCEKRNCGKFLDSTKKEKESPSTFKKG